MQDILNIKNVEKTKPVGRNNTIVIAQLNPVLKTNDDRTKAVEAINEKEEYSNATIYFKSVCLVDYESGFKTEEAIRTDITNLVRLGGVTAAKPKNNPPTSILVTLTGVNNVFADEAGTVEKEQTEKIEGKTYVESVEFVGKLAFVVYKPVDDFKTIAQAVEDLQKVFTTGTTADVVSVPGVSF